jgi:hypothetical protein
MLKRILLPIIFLNFFTLCASAQYTISAAPFPYTVFYDSVNGGTAVGSFTVTYSGTVLTTTPVTGISPKVGSRTVSWTKKGGGTAVSFTYDIFRNTTYTAADQINSYIKNAGSAKLFSHSSLAGSTSMSDTVNYYIKVTGAGVKAAGIYETGIILQSYKAGYNTGNVPNVPPDNPASANVTLSLVVSPTQTITVSSTDPKFGASPPTVAWGTITAAPSNVTFTVGVTANYRYNLLVSSQKGGSLKNPAGTEAIPYLLTMGLLSTNMTGTGTYNIALNQDYNNYTGGIAPTNFTGTISFPSFQSYTAGTYSDTLTFTISSQ